MSEFRELQASQIQVLASELANLRADYAHAQGRIRELTETLARRTDALHVLEGERDRLRAALLGLGYSLTLADHLGDVMDDLEEAFKQAGITLPVWDREGRSWRDAIEALGGRDLWDTELAEPGTAAGERAALTATEANQRLMQRLQAVVEFYAKPDNWTDVAYVTRDGIEYPVRLLQRNMLIEPSVDGTAIHEYDGWLPAAAALTATDRAGDSAPSGGER